jgi:hypothetical protein
MIRDNAQGGVNETDKLALERAKKVDLITLPDDIEGTNCYNCKWISGHKSKNHAMCTHPKVRQFVNERMCCILWTNEGEYRPLKREKGF